MTDNLAWVSRAFMDTTLVRYVTAEVYFDDTTWMVDTMKRNLRGEPMPAERFPKELYGK